MNKFLKYLLFVLTFSCFSAGAASRQSDISLYRLYPGKAAVSGRFVGADSIAVLENILVSVSDVIFNSGYNQIIDVDSDRRFAANIALPHPQYVWFRDIGETIFIQPGDTIDLTVDLAADTICITGSHDAIVLRSDELKDRTDRAFGSLKLGWLAGREMNHDDLQTYIDSVIGIADDWLDNYDADSDSIAAGCSHLAREIIRMSVPARALSDILDARSHYDSRKFVSPPKVVSGWIQL